MMKCDKCGKSCQKNTAAISVGEIKICQICVDKVASDLDNVVVNEYSLTLIIIDTLVIKGE